MPRYTGQALPIFPTLRRDKAERARSNLGTRKDVFTGKIESRWVGEQELPRSSVTRMLVTPIFHSSPTPALATRISRKCREPDI